MIKLINCNILALGIALMTSLTFVAAASSQEAQNNAAITLSGNFLICGLDRASGVFNGSSFIPDPKKHGFSPTPKALNLPDRDDRIFQEDSGWILWMENPTEENYFSTESNAFNEENLEWFLTYTYFSDDGPVAISLKRVCSKLRDIAPSQ